MGAMALLRIPFPQEGESLTSYIQRLAKENLVDSYTIWKYFFTHNYGFAQPYLTSRIDRSPHEVLDLEALGKMTGLNKTRYETMTILPLMRKLHIDKLNWSLAQRVFRGTLTKNISYCPLCLKEELHFNLAWQISEMNICFKHHVFLESKCPNCSKPVLHLPNRSEIGLCSYCYKELIKAKPRYTEFDESYNRVKNDWAYLFDPNERYLVGEDNLMNVGNSLIAKLFYLSHEHQLLEEQKLSFRLIIDSHNEIYFPYLRTILTLLRKVGLSLNQFAELIIPQNINAT